MARTVYRLDLSGDEFALICAALASFADAGLRVAQFGERFDADADAAYAMGQSLQRKILLLQSREEAAGS